MDLLTVRTYLLNKMPFGKYYPSKNIKFGNKTIKKPGGYSGLFWGSVYTKENKKIQNASNYFLNQSEENGLDEYDYWDKIDTEINKHCEKYISPYLVEDRSYHYQTGFGSNHCDGLIEFWLPVEVPEMPDFKFIIDNNEYTMKWQYSDGSD
jgi:hypothetical protein